MAIIIKYELSTFYSKLTSKFENYIKDLRELTLNYQTKELQKEHINPLNKS